MVKPQKLKNDLSGIHQKFLLDGSDLSLHIISMSTDSSLCVLHGWLGSEKDSVQSSRQISDLHHKGAALNSDQCLYY